MGVVDGIWVGIDVSKAHMDVSIHGGRQWREATDTAGLARLTESLVGLNATLVVIEASGGYEVPVAAAVGAAGLAVALVNPCQVRHFARATGILAKIDRAGCQRAGALCGRCSTATTPAARCGATRIGRVGAAPKPVGRDAGR